MGVMVTCRHTFEHMINIPYWLEIPRGVTHVFNVDFIHYTLMHTTNRPNMSYYSEEIPYLHV